MPDAVGQFRDNFLRARELGNLATAVGQLTTGAVDVSDMWRAQIVLGVSALDHLIHELARLGMTECAKGQRPKTEAYLRFPLPLDAVERGLSGQDHDSWLGAAIREKHSWLSFQHPDKIADAIRLISPVKLWEDVGNELKMPAKDVKVTLESIVDRRNKIAHEADMDPTNPGFRWPITETMTGAALDFVERVAYAIVKVTA